jgi:hypothetical protein
MIYREGRPEADHSGLPRGATARQWSPQKVGQSGRQPLDCAAGPWRKRSQTGYASGGGQAVGPGLGRFPKGVSS